MIDYSYTIEEAKKEIAEEKNLHPAIREFLKSHGDMAYLCTQGTKEQQIVTARGWENLSDCLYGYEVKRYPVSYRLVHQFIKSEHVASQFYQYYNLRGSCLTARDIFQILNGADSKEYVFCLENSQMITNAIRFVEKISEEAGGLLFQAKSVHQKIGKRHIFHILNLNHAVNAVMVDLRGEFFLLVNSGNQCQKLCVFHMLQVLFHGSGNEAAFGRTRAGGGQDIDFLCGHNRVKAIVAGFPGKELLGFIQIRIVEDKVGFPGDIAVQHNVYMAAQQPDEGIVIVA